jgi:hypothetical protein
MPKDGGVVPQIGEPFVGHTLLEALGVEQIDLIWVHSVSSANGIVVL